MLVVNNPTNHLLCDMLAMTTNLLFCLLRPIVSGLLMWSADIWVTDRNAKSSSSVHQCIAYGPISDLRRGVLGPDGISVHLYKPLSLYTWRYSETKFIKTYILVRWLPVSSRKIPVCNKSPLKVKLLPKRQLAGRWRAEQATANVSCSKTFSLVTLCTQTLFSLLVFMCRDPGDATSKVSCCVETSYCFKNRDFDAIVKKNEFDPKTKIR